MGKVRRAKKPDNITRTIPERSASVKAMEIFGPGLISLRYSMNRLKGQVRQTFLGTVHWKSAVCAAVPSCLVKQTDFHLAFDISRRY
jgi:hypothetical protein